MVLTIKFDTKHVPVPLHSFSQQILAANYVIVNVLGPGRWNHSSRDQSYVSGAGRGGGTENER